MNASPQVPIRRCPKCKSDRPLQELACENLFNGEQCGYFLADQPIVDPAANSIATIPPSTLCCANGHPLPDGERFCIQCGAVASDRAPDVVPTIPDFPQTVVGSWLAVRDTSQPGEPWQRFEVRHQVEGVEGVLILYCAGSEPDVSVQEVIRTLPQESVVRLLDSGRLSDRTYQVYERVSGGSLLKQLASFGSDVDSVRGIVSEIAKSLAQFARIGLRHRDIRPETVYLRSRSPLDLAVGDFGCARLADYDLESVPPLTLSRYSAPETIVGAVSGASDWWSLGIIALQIATSGKYFDAVHDRAYQINVVTRGVEIPPTIDPQVRTLLRGLLSKDPAKRWRASEVEKWVAGEEIEAPEDNVAPEINDGPSIDLREKKYFSPEGFALAAVSPANWDAARNLTLGGSVATWLQLRGQPSSLVGMVQRISQDENLSEDIRHSLAMMVINPSLPLVIGGEIVTPAYLLSHSELGHSIVTGETTKVLERIKREPWLIRLREREQAVRARAKLLEIDLNESRLRITSLATSRANLEGERVNLRLIFPDTDHAGLRSLLERSRLSDEDLLVLISASHHQFISLEETEQKVHALAKRVAVVFDEDKVRSQIAQPIRELYKEIDSRVSNFARSGNERIDEWADNYRVERRLPLDRAIVLLALPADRWTEPPRQQYVSNLLQHFEKRVSGSVQRGPLVRFILGKTTPRIDVSELGTRTRPAESLINHILDRSDAPIPLDPEAFAGNETLETRLRRLVNHASTFLRDTGIDGRYMGFPFLLLKDTRLISADSKPRIAPILLWPVAINMQTGGHSASLHFDRQREEVRINPALEGLLGQAAFQELRVLRDDLLSGASLRMADVLDSLETFAVSSGTEVCRIPGKETELTEGRRLVACAALFNAEFTGQAISEDLRHMRGMPLGSTALEWLLRLKSEKAEPYDAQPPEVNRYTLVESDPSQDEAIFHARGAPGLLVEGPPGTGKSQTIVNMVADAIGNGQSVLIVCQKQVALKVVQKRLEAEGLNERLFNVVDVNSDRRRIIQELRDQLLRVRQLPPAHQETLKASRAATAESIEAHEQSIDKQHAALHAFDEQAGRSYREILGELIELQDSQFNVVVPTIGVDLRGLNNSQLVSLEDACSSLAELWLESNYEISPLAVLQPRILDNEDQQQLAEEFARFRESELNRIQILKAVKPPFELIDPVPCQQWLTNYRHAFESLDNLARTGLLGWLDLFERDGGRTIINELRAVRDSLFQLEEGQDYQLFFEHIINIAPKDLSSFRRAAYRAAARPTFLNRLSPLHWRARRRITRFLADKGLPADPLAAEALHDAIELERALQPLRNRILGAKSRLRLPERSARPLSKLREELVRLIDLLERVEVAARGVWACPLLDEAKKMVEANSVEGFAELAKNIADATRRYEARTQSIEAVRAVSQWFESNWVNGQTRAIETNEPSRDLDTISTALPSAVPYQRFRLQIKGVDPLVLKIFTKLKGKRDELNELDRGHLTSVVKKIIRREALRAWKQRLETQFPELGTKKSELENKLFALARDQQLMREYNQKLLAKGYHVDKIGPDSSWTELTRLTGPRSKRLREIVELGADLGLMSLRPIWMMNPDVASRLLPRRASIFDVVIYDEASQILVEHAVPTLFRARRVIVSGDEKQMPPSSFFSTKIDSDEDEEFESAIVDDWATETERSARHEAWDRKEIKDCPDLLHLAREALPSRMLRVHYRSKYRELIAYSNSAFYRGDLSVPARQPDIEVRRARPIQVERVNGTYKSQVNEAEAIAVVKLLSSIWVSGAQTPPTIGVVTFNRKQADLIEDEIEKKALQDTQFSRIFQRERERIEGGEDVGFFVRNVENVQGDERDVIIFSTTFGRDPLGQFRKYFGVLGQAGGERRLNVAVTRAREKVILVTSMPIGEISDALSQRRAPERPRDYLQAYLDYATKVSSGDLDSARDAASRLNPYKRPSLETEEVTDGFSASVRTFIRSLGHEPEVANDGGAFALDFAIRDKRSNLYCLGIECDAPRHELLRSARARELWRPSVLERAIPEIHRVSSRGWFEDRDKERSHLLKAINSAVSGALP